MLSSFSFRKELQSLTQFPQKTTYLLAVSGGADSMVLAYLFNELRISGQDFHVAHINYKLRGEDSDADQKVVEDFCRKNDIKFHLYKVSEKDRKPENSIQLWARELRYRFFRKIQEEENLEFLVTAHHLNDQLETFIINLSKGSGINGLIGIPANENNILRPLLHFSKEEIYRFAAENNIIFREDLSNKKNDYLRNKIRNTIVPDLYETNDHFLDNFRKSISYLNQSKSFIQKQLQEIENGLSEFNSEYKILSKEKLKQESGFVQYEILKKYGFNQPGEIAKIFSAENGSSFFSENFILKIDRKGLILTKKDSEKKIDKEKLLIPDFSLENNQPFIDLSKILKGQRDFQWKMDADKLCFPLYVRKQKNGDLFYPSGFTGTKKVSKFFRDEKLSSPDKERTWLLCDSEDTILGIIPLRQDRRFLPDNKTQKTLTVQWIGEQQIL